MANHVRITTIAADTPQGMPESLDAAVDQMLDRWNAKLSKAASEQSDLIVIPECCDRYDDVPRDKQLAYYQKRGNRVLELFQEKARSNSCYITYPSFHQLDDGSWRNSIRLIDRDGNVAGSYRKNHLVIEENTVMGAMCGSEATVIETDFGRVGFAICFDLNFEPIRKRYVELSPDLMVFSSMYHGGLMQAYWAYFLRCHFVSAICGLKSEIISPVGETLAATTNYIEHVTKAINLDCTLCHLDYNWEKLDALKLKYGADVTIHDPGFLGSVLITSETNAITADAMIDEFDLERLDAYFARALAFHSAPQHIERS